ncbi:DOMON-like domain-containing protein [Alteriqipengyuania sp. 357]
METYRLAPHPAFPPLEVTQVATRLDRSDRDWLRLSWRVAGAEQLVLPPLAGPGRADELWKTTCFELFLMPGDGPAYAEFNLSPSLRWNAYDFTDRREEMKPRPMPREPQCRIGGEGSSTIFDAAIPTGGLPPLACSMGLTCVIEEHGGRKSYWALAHGSDAPDFHDPACFTARLAAPHAP